MSFTIKARIIGYYKDDLNFDYEDGSFEWFDSTKLRIIEPPHMKDKEFYIFHNSLNKIEDTWTLTGVTLLITFKEGFFEKWDDIFSSHTFIFTNAINFKFLDN